MADRGSQWVFKFQTASSGTITKVTLVFPLGTKVAQANTAVVVTNLGNGTLAGANSASTVVIILQMSTIQYSAQ